MTAPFLSLKEREEFAEKMDSEARIRFEQILRGYKYDLTANLRGSFAPHDFVEIIHKAGSMFARELAQLAGPSGLSYIDVNSAWEKVVTDFFRSRYWGFSVVASHQGPTADHFGLPPEQLEVHEREKIENDGNLKKAMPYLRQFIIGLIIWKIVVIYLAQQGCFDWGILRR